jgi:hypothetical protein
MNLSTCPAKRKTTVIFGRFIERNLINTARDLALRQAGNAP